MAISVADNFSYQGTKPLDSRVSFDTVSDMASASEATLYDGCFAYVKAAQKYYSYDSTNEVDPTTGKWREYSSGGGGGTGDYPDLTNKPSINGVELLGNKTVGLLSTNIQIDADKIGYNGAVSGARTVKNALNYLQETFDDFEEEAASAEIRLNCWTGFTSGTILVLEGPDEVQTLTLGSEAYIDFKVTHCGKYDIHVGGASGTVIGSIKVNALGYKYAMPIFNDGDSNYATVTVKTSDQNLVGKLCTAKIGSMVAAKFVFDEELSYTFKTNYTGQQHAIECAEMSATATITPENYGTNYDVSIATANPKVFPHVTASTTDITAGTTALPTNDIYLVYE